MDTLLVKGGIALEGEINASGSKNAVLPILMTSLLTNEPLRINKTPYLKDVTNTIQLLSGMGVECTLHYIEYPTVILQNHSDHPTIPDPSIAQSMRASILCLGPLLARYGEACFVQPGGCIIGDRPIDVHIDGFKRMGVTFTQQDDSLVASTNGKRLQGATIEMPIVSVTGTENLLMAATLAKGTTVLKNAALEPEITDLARCLISMGAKIQGHGTSTIQIEGVKQLKGTRYSVIPDRIEAATFLVAGAITGGRVRVADVVIPHLQSILNKLEESGARIIYGENWIELDARKKKLTAVNIKTAAYPNFPTDMQAQFVTLNAVTHGASYIEETVFEGRFHHITQLNKMGANLTLDGRFVRSIGGQKLQGTETEASDLRASAALILAGLVAEGETLIHKVHHIDRGYELIEEKLRRFNADILRLHHGTR